MENKNLDVTKSSGEKVKFSLDKLRSSLKRTGASKETIDQIIDKVRDELYQGISTREIYNRAFALLKKKKSYFASKYKLKKAIYELGYELNSRPKWTIIPLKGIANIMNS